MTHELSREQKARYATDGCVFPIDVLTRAEAAHYRRRLEDIEARCGNLHYSPKPHLTFTFVDDLIRDARILDRVEAIIGPDLLVWDSTFIIKEARDARFVSWHQDLTYWGLEPPDVVSVWLALSPSTPESGCMRFVPGSHTAQLPHHDTFAEQNILSRGQEVPSRWMSAGGGHRSARPARCRCITAGSSTARRPTDPTIGGSGSTSSICRPTCGKWSASGTAPRWCAASTAIAISRASRGRARTSRRRRSLAFRRAVGERRSEYLYREANRP